MDFHALALEATDFLDLVEIADRRTGAANGNLAARELVGSDEGKILLPCVFEMVEQLPIHRAALGLANKIAGSDEFLVVQLDDFVGVVRLRGAFHLKALGLGKIERIGECVHQNHRSGCKPLRCSLRYYGPEPV